MPKYTIQMTAPCFGEVTRELLVEPEIKNVDNLSSDLIWTTVVEAKDKKAILEYCKVFQTKVTWNK